MYCIKHRLWAIVALVMAGAAASAQTPAALSAKVEATLKKLTLEEKVAMIHGNSGFTSPGVSRLGIRELVMSDGPHGVRPEQGRYWGPVAPMADSGTYLPTGVCLAATWNTQLGYSFGSVLGSEANYRGKDIILGPGVNILRTPVNGRNFEYQSEDPYLVSKMVVGYVKGVQDQGVSACVKHYAANNIETRRNFVNVLMSERALREIYLPGFKAAVMEGGVNSLMGAYNKFRGQYCTHNDYLVNQVLKKEWGFTGVVMSDWGAVHNTIEALYYGCDLEMGTDLSMLPKPDYSKFYMGDTVIALVKSGKVAEAVVDEKVRRILYLMYKTNVADGVRKKGEYNTKAHQQTAQKIAEEGIVLLKNENKTLPLTAAVKSIAVIGLNADRKQSMGGGSSQIRAFYEITPLQGLKAVAGKQVNITYSQGYTIERGAQANAALIQEAADAARKAEVAIVVGGWTHGYNYNVWADNAYDAEDVDKPDMQMPFGQNELIKAVLAANPKTIVVLMGGGAVDMNQWINNTPAIVQAWYPGMEGGTALANILVGKVNPSGKLPMTFPKKLEDNPAEKLGMYAKDSLNMYYTDDIYVGYRYFDTYQVEPQFAFGHGLSYTTFAYGNLTVTKNGKGAAVTFTVKNTGKVAGAEVAQLYVRQEVSALPRPYKELKGFEKVVLQPGEEKKISINLKEDAFSYYDDNKHAWVEEPGVFDIVVGGSSRSLQLAGKVKM
ncbi:beta-glucosidase [Filimonas lacunae]|uniref:Beta-glucosidase n=1 Tax=Filimonas lacunae TaxID=477680 RepID=A0A173MN52_9BACT|nr:glycoside hydrolase family 3 C-terminal domain-containing protein [Filimonas lacunae]BAV08899.1 beta-glucosidase [Filimonas lacunae]SIS63661.1 beta-glucosidase [Filimonas lacunae]